MDATLISFHLLSVVAHFSIVDMVVFHNAVVTAIPVAQTRPPFFVPDIA